MKRLHTVATFLEVCPELVVQAEVQPIPYVVARLVADLGPLEDDLDYHVHVHRSDAVPKNVVVPALRELDQRDSECCLGQSLAYKRSAGCDVDQNVHAIVPGVCDVSSSELNRDQAIVDT